MLDLFRLNGETALVTGAARGIGHSMAIALAEAGADIILVLRSKTQTETADAIRALGRQCLIYECDLASQSQVSGLVTTIIANHSYSILVNNAGIQRRSDAVDFTQELYDEVMQVNVNATFTFCRDTGKYWIDNGIKGRIINTASLASFQGGVRMAGYAVSKGGVAMLTKALSNEWAGKGIRVNALAPGYIATDMNADTRNNPDQTYLKSITERIPAGKWGAPDDFKGPIIFLASRASEFVTGQILTVDGGWMAR